MVTRCVFFAVRTGLLNIIWASFGFEELNILTTKLDGSHCFKIALIRCKNGNKLFGVK
jgi:hypothetical protein